MSRYSTDMLYTFEFVVCISFFVLLTILWKKYGERNSLIVYTFAGLLHSTVELLAQGTGIREISSTYLFGTILISYPFLPFILGFFEGGLYCLLAYHFVRLMMNRDRFSLKFFSFFAIFFTITSTLGAFSMHSGVTTFTRREIFSLGALVLLSICIIIALGYFILNRRVTPAVRKSFFYFYLGLFLVTALMVIPLHISGVRFIEVYQEGSYVYASFWDQIAVMYGYSLAVEAAGFFLPYYILIYHFKLIQLK